MKIAIYPGTFDPITFGHLDIIKRANELFDQLIIGIAQDSYKNPIFTSDERVEMVKEEVKNIKNSDKIKVEKFEGLLINFAQKKSCQIIVRGLRAVSDFEYEFQMFGMNSKLDQNIQTIFLPASENHHFIASKLVKEIAKLGGNINNFVSDNIANKIKQKIYEVQS
jgi:pantetheine-phosphate adenylyltransferase